jgi:hypothetical protein
MCQIDVRMYALYRMLVCVFIFSGLLCVRMCDVSMHA